MDRMEQDLGTKLDWVAVDHFNTGHPHTHIVVRGKDDKGADLVIARDYMTTGIRERAAELVDLDLGPRTDREIAQALRAGRKDEVRRLVLTASGGPFRGRRREELGDEQIASQQAGPDED